MTTDAVARRVAELLAAAPPVTAEQCSFAVRLLARPTTSQRPVTRPAAKAPTSRAA